MQYIVDFLPTKGQTYWYLKNSIEQTEETQKHNKAVEMVKSLQSFIDPKAYKETYKLEDGETTLADGTTVGMVDADSDMGKAIQETTARMIKSQMEGLGK